MKSRFRAAALLIVVSLASAAMWSYWSRLPHAVHVADSNSLQPKNLTDLFPRWYGSREFILHHRDPYGEEISREIQIAFYGQVLDPNSKNGPHDEQRFAYPLYVVLLLAPTVNMDFSTVRAVFWWVLVLATVLNAFFWLRFFRMRLSATAWLALFLMILSSVPVLQGISILQLGLLVACFISAAAVSLVSGRLLLAGTLLAFATIKPQLALLPVTWFLFWALSNWRKRYSLAAGFATTLAVLIFSTEWMLPGWLLRYPAALHAYAGYAGASCLLAMLFPIWLTWPLGIAAALITLVLCWRARKEPADSSAFIICLCLAFTLTVLIVPTVVPPFNHVLLLPVAFLALVYGKTIWHGTPLTRFAFAVFCGFALLPWILALLLMASGFTIHSRGWWFAPLTTSLALPFAVFGLLFMLQSKLIPLTKTGPAVARASQTMTSSRQR